MKLDITQGVQRKGIEMPFGLAEVWGEDRWGGDTVKYVGPVRLSGSYTITGDTVLVRGVAEALVSSRCARCLAPTETAVSAPFSEAFVREGAAEAEPKENALPGDQYTYQGHELELTEAVRTAVLLEVPVRVLCRPDCKGLCPQCGANRNETACSCPEIPRRQNPFAALAERAREASRGDR